MSDYTPFKMKGSPFQRNFGIGSPVKQDKLKKEGKSLETKLQEQERKKGEKIESDLNKEQNRKKMPTVNLPQHIKVPTDEQIAKSKGTLKGVTGFEADYPIISKAIKLTNPISTTKRKIENVKKITEDVVNKGKKVYNYFTKK
jgi:hypothetical protein